MAIKYISQVESNNMLKYVYVILLLALWRTASTIGVDLEKDEVEGKLLPAGSNVCSYKETIPLQVNASFIDIITLPVRIRYTTYVWGFPRYRTRTVLREKTFIKYRMQTKLKEVDVYYCCNGWSRAKGSNECTKPVCAISCANGGQCTAPDICTCKPGYEGRFCQNDINECKDATKNTCEQGCINTRGSFKCFCKRGFKPHSEIPNKCLDINECEASPCRCPPEDLHCSAFCNNSFGSYQCSCGKGYRPYPDGTCRDINECTQNVCSQFCTNLPGSYRCDCMPGFQLNSTTGECEDINECEIRNGGCNQNCHNVEGGYVCSCKDNFYLSADRKTCEAVKKFNQFSRLCPDTYKSFVILSCWPSKVKIISAFYGRINDSHCHGDSKPFKPCSVNGITELLTKKCSGKDTCFVDASKEALRSLDDPCPSVEKYVEVTSTCA